jgi:hypothetical protein
MWDELKSEDEINAEITKQTNSCAWTLDLPSSQIFPISAQKALVAKINGDDALLERSRLPELELALSNELIPAKQDIVRDNTDAEFSDIYMRSRGLLESRLAGLREQLGELNELRGKNKGVVEYMMGKVRVEKEEFESGLQRYYAVRSVFSQMTNKLFGHLGLDALRQLTASTREAMHEATFSKTLSAAMKNFFNVARANLDNSEDEINEILSMMEAIYKKFAVEHGLKLGTPTSFSLIRHQQEVQRLEQWCDTHLNTMFQLMTHEKNKVTQKFFEEVASQVRRAFDKANHDAESWLKAIMAPMETQVREHQIQLKRRLESIKRIHQATDTLEDRIDELNHVESNLVAQITPSKEPATGSSTCSANRSARNSCAARPERKMDNAASRKGSGASVRLRKKTETLSRDSGRALVAGQLLVLDPEHFGRFLVILVLRDAIDRANLDALRRIVVAYALGALVRIDLIDLGALRNGFVRALRLAHVAVDAFVGDNQRHGSFPSGH